MSIRMPTPEDFPDNACWGCKRPVSGREAAWVAWALSRWEVYCYGCGARRLATKTRKNLRFVSWLAVLAVGLALVMSALRIWGWLS